MPDKKTIVIVEDDFLIIEYFEMLCTDLGLEVLGKATSAEEALPLLRDKKPDYVLMDVRLQGKRDGVDIANTIHAETPEMKIIFITGSNEPPTMDRIKTDDPHAILIKPINPDDLREALK